jgi:hypothetical protein
MNPENVWKPNREPPAGDPLIVDNRRSAGKSVLIIGLPHERNDWLRRLFMEQRPAWKPIIVTPEGSQLREFVETNFPNACVLIEPQRLTENLLIAAGEMGKGEADLIEALERVKPARPSPEAQILEIAAELEKIQITAATNGNPAECSQDRPAKRPRGFAKAKGWKAKQRAKRKAQRQARQRARA